NEKIGHGTLTYGDWSVYEEEWKDDKIQIIPFLTENGWRLYNPKSKIYLKDKFRDIKRNNQFTLCVNSNNHLCLFQNDKLLCDFPDQRIDLFEVDWYTDANFEIIDNKYILLFSWLDAKDFKVLDFQGYEIQLTLSENEITTLSAKRSKDDINVKDTFWEIKYPKPSWLPEIVDGSDFTMELYYKNHLVYSDDQSFFTEINIEEFHCGYALVGVSGFFGTQLVGYIDLWGNHYWSKEQILKKP
ncbi:hypothetical protein N9O51_06115, partial [Saprospiraceae bacterium]|nr:hypothetical protein [Saprospiraceae bacterium]